MKYLFEVYKNEKQIEFIEEKINGCIDNEKDIQMRFRITNDEYEKIRNFADENKITLKDILEILLIDRFNLSKEIIEMYINCIE